MTPAEMKAWIDGATYEQLLRKWRFDPPGSPWFMGEMGDYFAAVMARKGEEIGPEQKVQASKHVDWDAPKCNC